MLPHAGLIGDDARSDDRPEIDTPAMEVHARLPLDADQFMSRECPSCARRFKVKPHELPLTKLAHCPYCEHDGQDWSTPGQTAVIKALGLRMVAEQMNETMRTRG